MPRGQQSPRWPTQVTAELTFCGPDDPLTLLNRINQGSTICVFTYSHVSSQRVTENRSSLSHISVTFFCSIIVRKRCRIARRSLRQECCRRSFHCASSRRVEDLYPIGFDLVDLFHHAAAQIDKILKRTNPGEVPIYQARSGRLIWQCRLHCSRPPTR